MAKQRKKSTPYKSQKVLAAQYRNDFFHKMKRIIDSVCGTDIFPLLPKFLLEDVYLNRSKPFKVKAHPDCEIPSSVLKEAKTLLPHLIKEHTLSIPSHNIEIPLNEYFTVVVTIVILHARISAISFPNAQKVKDALQFFVNDTVIYENANKELFSVLNTFNLGDNDLRKALYWYTLDLIVPNTFSGETENIIIINSVTPESISIKVDGIKRPAIRAGWAQPHTGPAWIQLKPSNLGVKGPFAEIPLNVYIQSHAINRLIERIDCFWIGVVQLNMYSSLMKPIITHDTNHNLLIEFTIFNTKAGYFRADIVDGVILIRTFLFVTNSGTPEGQLLEKNTGLQKLDKKYLNIDKLSTFMNSDLDKNLHVQQLFKNAGCQCLLDLYTKMQPLLVTDTTEFNFDKMLSYLMGIRDIHSR